MNKSLRLVFRLVCIGLLAMLVGADSPATKPAPSQVLKIDLGAGISVEFILLPAGSFTMGSEKGEDDEQPVRKVTLTQPFYLGKFEVTQEQWQAVMGENPSTFKGPKNPVDNVNWYDCQEFLRKLAEKVPGRAFRLPTEAQWEYACRAGSTTAYNFGDDPAPIGDYAWYYGNSSAATHPVGQKKPNAWGLYDMHGNVCEWCADWYSSSAYMTGDATDPTGPASGEARVLRGESWVSNPDTLRSSYRVGTPEDYRNTHVGFRVVCLPTSGG